MNYAEIKTVRDYFNLMINEELRLRAKFQDKLIKSIK